MRLAFCLFKYNVFSGLALDFLQIALTCQIRGHQIEVFTKEWRGDRPKGFKIHEIAVSKWRNFRQDEEFINKIQDSLKANSYDCIIGFNKMPGLDIYFAADGCFKAKTQQGWKRILPLISTRYRFYSLCEHTVYNSESKTQLLLLSTIQKKSFRENYGTSEDRFKILPPGISKSKINQDDAKAIRANFRNEYGMTQIDKVLLMVGSGFRTKGLERAIKTFARLPEEIKIKTKLFVVGEGKQKKYIKLAKQFHVNNHLHFFGGRKDVHRFLVGSDILLHPSLAETGGKVIIEAMIHGLPVLTTDNCGYSEFVSQANAGIVAKTPFQISEFAALLEEMIKSNHLIKWSANGFDFGKNEFLYSMPEEVVKVVESN